MIEVRFPLIMIKLDPSILYKLKTKHYKVLGFIYTVIAFAGIGFTIAFLLKSLYDFIFRPNNFTPVVTPLIPGIEIGGLKLPLIEGIIAISIAALVHELAHAQMLVSLNRKIKSWGLALLGPILAAFVEPDEEEFKKDKPINRIMVLSAGPAVNIILGLIFLGLSNILFPYFHQYKCLKLVKTTNPDLEGVKCIYSIDNTNVTIKNIRDIIYKHKPGDRVIVNTDKGEIVTKLKEKNGKPFLGVWVIPYYIKKGFYFLYSLIPVLGIVNIGIGLANLVPLFITDGAQILREFLNKYWVEINSFFLTIVLINIIWSIL